MYSVIDYYENPFGDRIFVSSSYEACKEFVEMYEKETDGECDLQIVDPIK